jgi:two-component system sensor histidine kinase DesK
MGTLTYLPVVAFGVTWPGMAGFLAGSILMLRPARNAWILFTVVTVSMFAAPLVLGMSVRDAIYMMIASLCGGLTVFALYQLRLAAKRAHGESTEVAQLTTARERERFARDLHDILGYSLSAITLKAELTRKLVASDPALAQDELTEVVELARQAAVDVRLVANGYSSVSLTKEAASAASLLTAACITPKVTIDCGVLDDKIDAVLALVLREAVTNVLRHSSAQNCAIEASQDDTMVTLTVINDGVPPAAKPSAGGHGLRNLAWRLEAIGGELNTEGVSDDRFSLSATVPAHEVPPSAGGATGRAAGRAAGGRAGRAVDGPAGGAAGDQLSGSQCVGDGKPVLGWRHIGLRRLKVGQGEEDRQVRRPPGAQFDSGGDDGVGAHGHRADSAHEKRPARPRLGVRVVRYCYRTDEPRAMGHPSQLK